MLCIGVIRSILAGLTVTIAFHCALAQPPAVSPPQPVASPPQRVTSPSPPAQSDIRPLALGQPIERELKGGEVHSYSLTMQAGQFLNVVVEQKGIDVAVILFDSNNKNLSEIDGPNGSQGPESLFIIIETTGNYRVDVRSLEKTAPAGRYEAKLVELRLATEKDKKIIVAQKVFAEGEVLRMQGKADSVRGSIKKYENALAIFQALGDKNGEAETINSISTAHFQLGETQQALKFVNELLRLYRTLGNKSKEAALLNDMADINGNFSEYQKALEYYSQALSIRRSIGDKIGEAKTLTGMGAIYALLGENQKSLEYYSQSMALRRVIDDKVGEALTLNQIGFVYRNLGEKRKAVEFFLQSLALHRAVGEKGEESSSLANLGVIYNDLGDNQKALEYYSQALPLHRVFGDRLNEATTLTNMGVAYFESGDKQKALQSYLQSLPLGRASGNRRGDANTLYRLSIFWNNFNNSRLAIAYGKLAVNNFQRLRANITGLDKNVQRTFLETVERRYRLLANNLIADKRLSEAQEVLNFFKDQQFFDFSQKKPLAPLSVTVREAEFGAALDQKLKNVVSAIRALDDFRRGIGMRQPTPAETGQLKSFTDKQTAANDEYLAFIKSAEKEFAAPPDEKDKVPEISDLKAMQDSLRETSAATGQGSVAVYSLVGEENYRALIVTADDVFSVSTPIKEADLNKKAAEFWSLLRTPKYDPQTAANELYKIVFKPIEAKLPKGTKTILWSLDGNLRYIPVAALHDGKRYLAERFQNVIFTRADKERMTRSVSIALAGTGMGSSEAHTVDLLGDKFNASALPAVKDELERIFQGSDDKGTLAGGVLLDSRFTKKAALAELKIHRPLVHIASHFRFEPGDEARSFLLMGDGTPWTLDEMKKETDLFAGVDLLTLSACETAAQRPDANGREVDGFAELAQRLGAGAVMASLWEVADNSTSEMMARFYKNYRGSRPMNKAESLRRAQLALLKGVYNETPTVVDRQLTQSISDSVKVEPAKLKPFRASKRAPYAHPYYWSPFILIGNWK
ncbi:MAG: CHAT domain-containing protein [Pyrinomonadaceae bacterium]